MRKTRNTGLVTAASTLVLSALVGSSGALAQSEQKNIDGASIGKRKAVLEEVLVTATKKSRAENVQDIPIAITAMNEDQLNAMHFENIADIGHAFPNATLDEAQYVPGQAAFFIRGVGASHTAQTSDPSVGVVINGMALGQNIGATTDSFDLESLEVLRGPQGTLFGRNTTGGVVVLRTKRPTGDFGFEMRGALGSDKYKSIKLGIESSLVEDSLSGRLAVLYKENDGYFDNAQGGSIGKTTSKIIRPTLRFTPDDSLEITLFSEYAKFDADTPPLRNIFDPETDFSTFYIPPSDDLQTLDQDFDGPNYTEWWHVIGELNWDIGPGRFTSITAYRELEAVVSIDVDASSVPAVHFLPSLQDQDQFSQELRYAFNLNERINLTAGLYYFDLSYRGGLGLDVFGDITLRDGFTDHKAYATFVQGDFEITENWVLTLGGRYTEEDKEGRYATTEGGGCAVAPASDPTRRVNCNYDFEGSKSWKDFSPKVGIQWIINDSTQAYASWTKGFKSGGFHNEADTADTVGPYDGETVEAYEVGLKMDLLEGRMRLNLAAFLNEYSDMQRSILRFNPETGSFNNQLLNAGSAEVMGFEAELTSLLTERLSVTASLGLMSNDIKTFEGLDVDGDGIPDPEEAKKLDLARVPDVTYGVSLVYDIPLSVGDITLRSDYTHTGERYANDNNSATLDPYRSLNLSATYLTTDGRYSVSVFGKNVLNDDAKLFVNRDAFFNYAQISTPATWGVEATFRY